MTATPIPAPHLARATLVLVCLGFAAGALAAEPTVGQKLDAAIERTGEAATTLKEDAREAASAASDAAQRAGTAAADKAADIGRKVEARADDAAITALMNAGLARDPDLSVWRIDVDTRNGVVTLTGPAPNAAAKERATGLARAIQGVAGVNNLLEVR